MCRCGCTLFSAEAGSRQGALQASSMCRNIGHSCPMLCAKNQIGHQCGVNIPASESSSWQHMSEPKLPVLYDDAEDSSNARKQRAMGAPAVSFALSCSLSLLDNVTYHMAFPRQLCRCLLLPVTRRLTATCLHGMVLPARHSAAVPGPITGRHHDTPPLNTRRLPSGCRAS